MIDYHNDSSTLSYNLFQPLKEHGQNVKCSKTIFLFGHFQ